MRRRLQLALLVALLLATAGATYRAIARWRDYQRAETTCAATRSHDWQAALASSRRTLQPTVSGLRSADCRCEALVETGGRAQCEALLERLLADPRSGDWLPRAPLTLLMVSALQSQGRMDAALQLAARGSERYPEFYPILLLETVLRLRVQEPGAALDAMAARIPRAGAAQARLRILLADEAGARQDYERTLALAGEQPLPGEHESQWFELRGTAFARLGRRRQLLLVVERWAKVNPRLAHGFYGLILSATQQMDVRGRTNAALMREAIDAGDELGDEDLLRRIYGRYIGDLAVRGHTDEALRYFDEAKQRFGSVGWLDRADLARTALLHGLPGREEGGGHATGRLELRVAGAQPGMELLVSPPASAPHDQPFETIPVPPGGAVRLSRALDVWPVHWVLRDPGGVRGSGAAWPDGGTVTVTPRRVVPMKPPLPLVRRPAAGGRRLFVVILDCGDWRFIRRGIARGELPAFAAFLADGPRAVLSSVPAYTAVAIRSLVSPGARGVDGTFGVLHQLGDEAAGLNFIGRNPLAPLAWVLPEQSDLFATLGAGELRAANLLHSYGGLQVGRNGEVVGPHGERSMVSLQSGRKLRPDENELIGMGPDDPEGLINEMAADFDNVTRLAAPGGPDMVMIRVASLDLLTHGSFPAVVRAGQDDGVPALFHFYRLIDLRLGELYRALDGNDALVVMSDHGIATALQHDPQAMFLVAGAGAPPERIADTPEIRGVPRWIADFLAVPTSWPATGLEAWLPASTPSP